RQRDLIVDTFFSQQGHLSVDELLEKVTARDASIGAATVYRTMKILTDAGLASARHFEGGQTRYEAALDRHHHDHLICTSCGNLHGALREHLGRPNVGGSARTAGTHRRALEYGPPGPWARALYHDCERARGAPLHFQAGRLESRYRLAQAGPWANDEMLYLEA